ncbi:MAG: DNA polymerase III subunit delta [Rikenellaceae bacterium]
MASFEAISNSIARGEVAPIYLLMGEESYFIDALCDKLAESLLPPADRAFNQVVMYGRDTEAGAVINFARQVPMMGDRSVIIVKEAQGMKGIEKLAHYSSSPISSTVLVICHKEKNIDKRSQLYKSILKCGVVLESVRPRDYEIGGWLSQFVASKGAQLDAKASAMLIDHLGADLAKISNEVSKLMIAMADGATNITPADIEQHIGISKDFNNFELCKALITRDSARALLIADHFAHNQKANPLLVTIIALFNQFKQMFLIGYLRWQTQSKGVQFPSDSELMRIVKVNNPYAVAELKQAGAQWPNRTIFNILGLLREYDAKSKGINTGGASEGEILRELILRILAQ